MNFIGLTFQNFGKFANCELQVNGQRLLTTHRIRGSVANRPRFTVLSPPVKLPSREFRDGVVRVNPFMSPDSPGRVLVEIQESDESHGHRRPGDSEF